MWRNLIHFFISPQKINKQITALESTKSNIDQIIAKELACVIEAKYKTPQEQTSFMRTHKDELEDIKHTIAAKYKCEIDDRISQLKTLQQI